MRLRSALLICFIQMKLIIASDVNISAICESIDKICIWKCCPLGKVIKRKRCVTSKFNDLNITVYDDQLRSTKKKLKEVFRLIPRVISNDEFNMSLIDLMFFGNLYLTQSGILYLEVPNNFDRWKSLKPDRFCIDTKVKHGEIVPVIMGELEEYNIENDYFLFQIALIVSIVSLMLTMLPYAIFTYLRDMNGVILIIFIASFIIPMILEVCMINNTFTLAGAFTLSMGYYFCVLFSFFWTYVMFYRLRWERQVRVPPQISKIKTCIAYTVVLPLTLTIMTGVIENNEKMLSNTPWFVTPQVISHGNFNFKDKESLFYLYIPLLLLLFVNWTLTVIHFIQKRKTNESTTFETENTNLETPLNRCNRYIALLIVLTFYCLVQIIVIFSPLNDSQIFLDICTLCVGPLIFITFVVHKSVLRIAKEYFKKQKTDDPLVEFVKDESKKLNSPRSSDTDSQISNPNYPS